MKNRKSPKSKTVKTRKPNNRKVQTGYMALAAAAMLVSGGMSPDKATDMALAMKEKVDGGMGA